MSMCSQWLLEMLSHVVSGFLIHTFPKEYFATTYQVIDGGIMLMGNCTP